MDTMSRSRDRPHWKSYTFLHFFLPPPWEIGAENRLVECYYYYCCRCCCCRWWYLLLGLLALWPSISSLLQSATSVITKFESLFYYKVRQIRVKLLPLWWDDSRLLFVRYELNWFSTMFSQILEATAKRDKGRLLDATSCHDHPLSGCELLPFSFMPQGR